MNMKRKIYEDLKFFCNETLSKSALYNYAISIATAFFKNTAIILDICGQKNIELAVK